MSQQNQQQSNRQSSADAEATSRLAFIRFEDDDRRALAEVKPVIARALGPALDRFYAQVQATAQTRGFFRSSAHVAGAKSAQQQHWDVICDGGFGADYVKKVTAIGRRHAAIGLEPRWYIGGYALVAGDLIEAIVTRGRWRSRAR